MDNLLSLRNWKRKNILTVSCFLLLAMLLLILFSENQFIQPTVAQVQSNPGEEWVWRNPLPQGNELFGIAWSGSRFVAVGADGTIINSPDGVSWTNCNSGTTIELNSISWSGSQFVAVGNSGTILTSPDGVNWTKQTSGTGDTLRGVVWGGNQFVAVGNNKNILTSPDGIIWTAQQSVGFE